MIFKTSNIRVPAVENQFYPGNPEILKKMIYGYLDKAEVSKIEGKIKAIIVPHAGYIYSAPIAAYSYKLLKSLDREVLWKVLLLGPSHHIPFSGAAVSPFSKWQMPFGFVDVADIRKEIGEKDSMPDIPDCDKEEHSLEVQVPFLQMVLKNFVLYPLVLGNIRSDWLANDLVEFCKKEDVIVVASSDLSHYLPYEEAKKIDFATSEAICNLDIDELVDHGDACGIAGILTLLHIAKALEWKCKMLDYRNSGDTAGTKDAVVGYGAWVFYK